MPILTKQGRADMATAIFEGTQVEWGTFVIGDGNGSSYPESEDLTAVKNEVYRGEVNGYNPVDSVTGRFELIVPANVGGFTMREVGILNKSEELVAIHVFPQGEEYLKRKFESGSQSSNDFVFYLDIGIENADNVKISIDPYTAVASREYVNEEVTRQLTEFTGNIEEEIGLDQYVKKVEGKDLVETEKVTQIDTNKSDIAELKSWKGTTDSTVTELSSWKETTDSTVQSLESFKTTTESTLGEIETSMGEVDVTELEGRVQTVETTLDGLDEALSAAAAKIGALA